MFKALVWKEWRQLALVRWGGIALGALLPLAFVAGAEMSQRGLLPTGVVKEYAARDLLYELLPAAYALGLWPLIALMSAAQAFGGDRSAGTEDFLLERPVPRGRTWRARLLASLGNFLAVVIGTTLLGAMIAWLSTPAPAIGWSRWLILGGIGVGVAILGWIGGGVAASLLPSPLASVLLGGGLGAVPLVLGANLSLVFLHARYRDIPYGMIVPWLLIPCYFIAAYAAVARGEPGGRGRLRRAVTVFVVGLVAIVVVFVVGAPLVLRAEATRGAPGVLANSTGSASFVGYSRYGGSGGWLVDAARGRRVQFVAPPLDAVAWSPDGERVAMATASGFLGGESRIYRVEIRRREGAIESVAPLPFPGLVRELVWCRDGLVALLLRFTDKKKESRLELYVLRPDSGVWTSTGFECDPGGCRIEGPLDDGGVLVREVVFRRDEKDRIAGVERASFSRVDVGAARVGAELGRLRGDLSLGWAGISRSGRYAEVFPRAHDGIEAGPDAIVDITTGATVPGVSPRRNAVWLRGDRLAWIERSPNRSRLVVASLDVGARAVREWRSENVGLMPSPGRGSLFVSALPTDPGDISSRPDRNLPPSAPEIPTTEGKVPEEIVYTLDGDHFIPLGPPFSDRLNDHRYTVWAGPRALARIAPGVVAFEDIDAPGKRRFVLGSERRLR